MIDKTTRHNLWRRLALLAVFMIITVCGMLVVRWAILSVVFSDANKSPFSKLRLEKGITVDLAIDKLGQPTARLRFATEEGRGRAETLIYREAGHELELTFVNNTLHEWSDTKPFDEEQFRNAAPADRPLLPGR